MGVGEGVGPALRQLYCCRACRRAVLQLRMRPRRRGGGGRAGADLAVGDRSWSGAESCEAAGERRNAQRSGSPRRSLFLLCTRWSGQARSDCAAWARRRSEPLSTKAPSDAMPSSSTASQCKCALLRDPMPPDRRPARSSRYRRVPRRLAAHLVARLAQERVERRVELDMGVGRRTVSRVVDDVEAVGDRARRRARVDGGDGVGQDERAPRDGGRTGGEVGADMGRKVCCVQVEEGRSARSSRRGRREGGDRALDARDLESSKNGVGSPVRRSWPMLHECAMRVYSGP